jgi:hypothetical protein
MTSAADACDGKAEIANGKASNVLNRIRFMFKPLSIYLLEFLEHLLINNEHQCLLNLDDYSNFCSLHD